MASDPPPFTLNNFLPYQLSVLSNQISRNIATLYETRFGLTIPEWRVIAVLGETSDLTATKIAKKTVMDKAAVSRAVKSLITQHYVRRKSLSAGWKGRASLPDQERAESLCSGDAGSHGL